MFDTVPLDARRPAAPASHTSTVRPPKLGVWRVILRVDVVALAVVSVLSGLGLAAPALPARVAVPAALLLLVVDYGLDHWRKR